MLEFRLGYPAAKWRNVYKALTVLEFLLKRGSDACVAIAGDDMMFRLDHLARNFDYFGADGRDHGINVRHRRVGEPHFVQRKHAAGAVRTYQCWRDVMPAHCV